MNTRPMVSTKGVSKSFFACPGTIYCDDSVVNKFIDLRFNINDGDEEVLSVIVNGVTVSFPYEYAALLARQAREMREETT